MKALEHDKTLIMAFILIWVFRGFVGVNVHPEFVEIVPVMKKFGLVFELKLGKLQ